MKQIITLLAALVTGLQLAGPAQASGPLRSGTIIGLTGNTTGGWGGGCWATLDCAAWRAAGCDPRLAGRDPGVAGSIVDVGEFAGTTRTLRFSSGVAWVEFWSAGCRGLGTAGTASRFTVPVGTRWMSISSYCPCFWHTVLQRWELW